MDEQECWQVSKMTRGVVGGGGWGSDVQGGRDEKTILHGVWVGSFRAGVGAPWGLVSLTLLWSQK